MGTEAPYLSGVFRFVARLHTLSRRGMRMALAGQPKCRYGMLQSLYNLIEQHGCDGAIYVSDIARQMHQPMPAISRGLRQMEQTGHIVRETDPKDRRKTLVRITPAGERARKANEQAMNDYLKVVTKALEWGIVPRCHFEDVTRADIYGFCLPFARKLMELSNAVKDALLAAIEAENAAMKTDLKGEPPHDENF